MDDERENYVQKDPPPHAKGNIPWNYWSITCLPVMWKILTRKIREEIYSWLICNGSFSGRKKKDAAEEQEEQMTYKV